jgi:hypothetical protein
MSRKVIDYAVVRSVGGFGMLADLVKQAIANGWEPIGGPVIENNGEVFQAMVYYAPEEDQ